MLGLMNDGAKRNSRHSPNDPFLEQFFSRLPDGLEADFTDRQLAALKSDFGDATRSGHGYDIRLSLPSPLPGRGAYVVLLGGRDRRGDRPVRRSAKRFGWRGLVFLVKLVVGLLFVLHILIAAVALMVWLL